MSDERSGSSAGRALVPGLLAALALAVGAVGPALLPNRTEAYEGALHDEAREALYRAGLLVDNPIERGLLRAKRIAERRPLPAGTRGPTGALCRGEWIVELYTLFWVRYDRVLVTCDEIRRL